MTGDLRRTGESGDLLRTGDSGDWGIFAGQISSVNFLTTTCLISPSDWFFMPADSFLRGLSSSEAWLQGGDVSVMIAPVDWLAELRPFLLYIPMRRSSRDSSSVSSVDWGEYAEPALAASASFLAPNSFIFRSLFLSSLR